MLAIGGYGFSKGDPALLIMGTDYEGVLCDEKVPELMGLEGNAIDNTGLKNQVLGKLFGSRGGGESRGGGGNHAVVLVFFVYFGGCEEYVRFHVSTTIDDGWECDVVLRLPRKQLNMKFHEEAWVLKNGDVYSDLTDAEKSVEFAIERTVLPGLIPSVNTYFSCNYYSDFVGRRSL